MAKRKRTVHHTSSARSSRTTGSQNLLAAVAYVFGWISGIILLLIKRNDPFVRFHAMQSLVTFGGIAIVNILVQYIPGIGGTLSSLLSLLTVILWVILIVVAFQGKMYELPYIGEFARKQADKLR